MTLRSSSATATTIGFMNSLYWLRKRILCSVHPVTLASSSTSHLLNGNIECVSQLSALLSDLSCWLYVAFFSPDHSLLNNVSWQFQSVHGRRGVFSPPERLRRAAHNIINLAEGFFFHNNSVCICVHNLSLTKKSTKNWTCTISALTNRYITNRTACHLISVSLAFLWPLSSGKTHGSRQILGLSLTMLENLLLILLIESSKPSQLSTMRMPSISMTF